MKTYNDSKEAHTLENCLAYIDLYKDEKCDYSAWTSAQDYLAIRKLARQLATIDVHACNGTKYADDASYELATKKIYGVLDGMLTPHGINFYHQTDPRGASLYVSREPLTANDYTHGIAIV